MYFIPYNLPCDHCMMRQMGGTSSFIRVLHASPGAPRVDVYANDKPIVRDVIYREFTPYVRIMPGRYNIKVYPVGTTSNPLVNTTLTLEPNTIYTVAAIGKFPNVQLYPVPEPRVSMQPGKANIRFVHLSPNSPAVDITNPEGKVIFPNVSYKGITNYVPISPGKHTLQARVAGTNNIVLNVPNIMLKPKSNYTVYAIGLTGEKPELQVLIPLDGSTYLK